MADRKDIKSGELGQLIANYVEHCSLADLVKLANTAFPGSDVEVDAVGNIHYSAGYSFGFED